VALAGRARLALCGRVLSDHREELHQNKPALVADALAQARRLVYETGDPTYLAYAFYGDAQLEFVRAR
jgi:hypothetical protein